MGNEWNSIHSWQEFKEKELGWIEQMWLSQEGFILLCVIHTGSAGRGKYFRIMLWLRDSC